MADTVTSQSVIYSADFLEIQQCRRGVFGFYKTDTVQGRSLATYGELYDPQVSLLLELIEPDDLVIDVGAGIGAYTIPLARKLLRQGGVVYAFEPARLNQQLLSMNVALNRLVNVFDYRHAVGKTVGSARTPLMNPLKKQDFSKLPNVAGQGDPVQVVTLDQLEFARCRLIKIDVNGSEEMVLSGAAQLIERLQPVLFLVYPGQGRLAGVLKLLESFGYEAWWHFADLFQPNNFRRADKNLFDGQVPDINILALPKQAGARFPNMVPVEGVEDDWEPALARGRARSG